MVSIFCSRMKIEPSVEIVQNYLLVVVAQLSY